MFSFQRYHFHFGALIEKENVILFIDRTRLLSISKYESFPPFAHPFSAPGKNKMCLWNTNAPETPIFEKHDPDI